MTSAGLDVDLSDGILRLTLNRPESLNSLNAEVLSGISAALDSAGASVKVVRLGGAGRAFSSGGSIGADDLATASSRSPGDLVEAANRAVLSIRSLPHPVVAA